MNMNMERDEAIRIGDWLSQCLVDFQDIEDCESEVGQPVANHIDRKKLARCIAANLAGGGFDDWHFDVSSGRWRKDDYTIFVLENGQFALLFNVDRVTHQTFEYVTCAQHCAHNHSFGF